MSKVLIQYEADVTSLKAAVNDVVNLNDDIVTAAQKSANEVGKAYKGAAKSVTGAFAVNDVKNTLKGQTDALNEVANSTQTAGARLKQLKAELNLLAIEGKIGSDRFKELSLEAAKLSDTIGDTASNVKNLASDTFKFDVAVEATQALAGTFQVAIAASTLFGAETQDLQKQLVKVNATVALANGVNQLAGIFLTENKLKTQALATATKVYTFVTTGATTATKLWRAALVTIGIGGLITVLGLLFDKITGTSKATEEATDSAREYQKAIDDLNKSVGKSATSAANAQIELLNKQGRISDETSKKLIAANNLNTAISDNNTAAKEKETEAFKRFEEQKVKDKELFGKELQVTSDQLNKDLKAIEEERVNNEKALNSKLQLDIIAINEDAANKRKVAAEKAIEETNKLSIERLKIIQQGLKREEIILGINEELKIKQIKNNADIEKQEARNSIKNAELLNATLLRIEAEKNLEIENIKFEFAKKEADNEIKKLEILSTLKRSTLNDELKLIEFRRVSLENQAKQEIKNKEELELRITEIEANALNERNEAQFNYNKQISELAAAQLELNKALGDQTLSNEIGIINQKFLLREQELRNNAANTIEAQKKLNVDLLLLEQERIDEIKKIKNQSIIDEIELENTKLKTLIEIGNGSISDRIKLIQNEGEIRKKEVDNEIKDAKRKAAEIELINAETESAIRKERKNSLDDGIAKAEEYIGEIQNVFGALNDLSKANTEARISDIETQSSAELDAINRAQISEQEKNKQKQALELRTNRAITIEKIKQAKRDKAIAIFNAAIDVAMAILKTGAQLGYPAAIPFQIAAGVVGATQIAAINAQQLPKFKKGGLIKGRLHSEGGTIIEAERGEYIVNRSQSSLYKNELEAINSSSSAFKKLINEKYIRPALIDFALNSKNSNPIIKATLNSKSMEKEIKSLNKKMNNKNIIININQNDSRYTWQ